MTHTPQQNDWRCDVLDIINALARRKYAMICVLLISIGIGLMMAQRAQPFYQASTTFVLLPREKPILDLAVQSSSIETAEDAAKRADSATLTLPPNPDLYTSLIRSGEVTQRVAKSLEERGDLSGSLSSRTIRSGTTVEASEEGVIKLRVTHANPRTAAAIVNALVHECSEASKAIERQLILQQAGFLGEAITRAEASLADSRDTLRKFNARVGVSDPQSVAAQSRSLLQTLDDTEARLSRELQRLAVHRTEMDPTVVAIKAELERITTDRRLTRERFCGSIHESEYAEFLSTWKALEQDVLLRQDLLMSMRARHEVFAIRADQPAGNLAVIRPATAPTAPAGPSKKKAIALAFLIGAIGSIGTCVFLDQLERTARDPRSRGKLDLVRQHLSLRPLRQSRSTP